MLLWLGTACEATEGVLDTARALAAVTAATDAPTPTLPEPVLDLEEARYTALRHKLNAYIGDCTNTNSEAVYRSREAYTRWYEHQVSSERSRVRRTDFVSGFTRARPGAIAAADLSGTERCTEGVARVATIEPRAPELEKVASEYAAALSVVTPLLNEHSRQGTAGQRDPAAVREAKQLYARFEEAWDRFAAANLALERQIQSVTAELDQRTLKRLAEEGPEIDYLAKLSMMAARKVTDAGRSRLADPAAGDLNDYIGLVGEYERKLSAMAAFAETHRPSVKQETLQPYLSRSREFLTSAKDLAKRSPSPSAKPRLEKAPQGRGDETPVQLLVDFNDVIGAYNEAQHAGGFARL